MTGKRDSHPNFPGYGTCGIAIADLSIWPLNPPLGKVVIVTTLNGELVIFEVQSGGSLNPQPLQRIAAGGRAAKGCVSLRSTRRGRRR